MEMGDMEFELLLYLIRTMEEKDLHNENIQSAISKIVNDFSSRLTQEQENQLLNQFPHLFSRQRRELGKELPLYDYF